MKIEDCKTLPEFFGVDIHDHIWVEGKRFKVYRDALGGEQSAPNEASRALVGCLTGQLKWSKTEPMSEAETELLREIAAWFPRWKKIYPDRGLVAVEERFAGYDIFAFGDKTDSSKAYTVLVPILEKHGEINLDEYREASNERD